MQRVTASYEKEAYFHNYKARCILDFNNKKDANLKNLPGGGGGGHDKLCKLL